MSMIPETPQQAEFPNAALKEALAVAIADGCFSDTAYYLFSRRTPGGKVGSPRAVYASSLVMAAAAEHFRAQLGGEFSINDEIPKETEGYAYDEDSDIEDTDDCGPEDFENISPRESESTLPAESYVNSQARGNVKEDESTALSASLATADIAKGVKFRVFVPDVAATTWEAMLYYLYTGTISFSPLKSARPQKRALPGQTHGPNSPKRPPLCSPKSAYRLADIVGLTSLKNMAGGVIKSQLSESSIAAEIFSAFSSYYPEILNVEMEFLFEGGVIARVLPQINENIRAVVRGDMPHAETALCSLVAKLSEVLVLGQTPTLEYRYCANIIASGR